MSYIGARVGASGQPSLMAAPPTPHPANPDG
jgi:hypothetical protein